MELVGKHHSRPHHYKRVTGDPVTLSIRYPIALVFVCVIDVSEHSFPRTILLLHSAHSKLKPCCGGITQPKSELVGRLETENERSRDHI